MQSVVAIVLNWCAESDTAACLDSLRASTYRALRILLVDNASPDGSGDRLHAAFPDVDYLQTGANLGYAGGNNRGIAWALDHDAEFVLIINNDTVVDARCVELLVETHRNAEQRGARIGGVAPKMLYFDAPDRIWFGGGDMSKVRGFGLHRHEFATDDPSLDRGVEPITFMTGCCFLTRASVFRDVGAFDEAFFMYAEDLELSIRMTEAGYTMLYDPRARLLHRIAPGRRPPSAFIIRLAGLNRRRVASLHFSAVERLAFSLWFYPTRAVHFLEYCIRGQWAEARAEWIGAFGALGASSAPAARA